MSAERFQYAKCLCDCGWYVIVDTATHRVAGATPNASDATTAADRLNRGIAVPVEPDEVLSVRNPRAIVQGLLLGAVAYAALVGVVAMLGPGQ